VVTKTELVDLMNLADPDDLNRDGGGRALASDATEFLRISLPRRALKP